MKRTLPLLVVLALGVAAAACKDDSPTKPKQGSADNGGEQPGGENGEQPGGGGPGQPPTAEEMNTNPAEGVEPATVFHEAGAFTDGPVWQAEMGFLFFTKPLGDGELVRALADGRVLSVRKGVLKDGTQPIGNTVSPTGEIITVEAKRITRQAAAGGDVAVIATSYTGKDPGPPDPLNPDAGTAPITPGAFDTLNDVVARKDGTMYVTDPGYFAGDTVKANRIYRITPTGTVQVVEAFEDVPRPNGIALSPDEKTLYVGFTLPTAGTLPFIRKYIVNEDGTLGEWTKFVDIGPADSSPDGLAVDKVGNLYVATMSGIAVYKPDGSTWGTIAVPEQPTGLTFGGPDMKTLFVTTAGVKVWQIKAKLSGLSQ